MLWAEGFSIKSSMNSGSHSKLEFEGWTLLYIVCFTLEQALLRTKKKKEWVAKNHTLQECCWTYHVGLENPSLVTTLYTFSNSFFIRSIYQKIRLIHQFHSSFPANSLKFPSRFYDIPMTEIVSSWIRTTHSFLTSNNFLEHEMPLQWTVNSAP